MDNIIDSITLYTVENGLLTCLTTVISLICWLMMPHNLIFLGLHFVISKLYSNTFLATLNARNGLRGRSRAQTTVRLPDNLTQFSRREPHVSRYDIHPITPVQISVEKTVQSNIYEDLEMSHTQRYRFSTH
ncbi:hypothetical protein QCA50_014303 [Cerrena zonata]|uniref:DUF6534 domain-containing protein n=1 Tax=Cerrena zonata TaxID=2478898 RepID=A0AAW0FY33_9APHY